MNKFTPVVALAALLLSTACGPKSTPAVTPGGGADNPAPKKEGPSVTAEQVMDRYVEVTGGAAAYRALKTSKTTGSMEMVGSPLKGTIEGANAEGKYIVTINFTGIGKIQLGYDGTTVWSMDPMSGARIITGVERSQNLRQNDPQAPVKWREMYSKYELKGTEDLDGKKVHVVSLVDVDGVPETRYFDAATGYMVKSVSVAKTQQGDVPAEVTMTEYTDYGGFKMPKVLILKQGPQTFKVTTASFEVNPTIDPAVFALPDDIKKLVDASAGK